MTNKPRLTQNLGERFGVRDNPYGTRAFLVGHRSGVAAVESLQNFSLQYRSGLDRTHSAGRPARVDRILIGGWLVPDLPEPTDSSDPLSVGKKREGFGGGGAS